MTGTLTFSHPGPGQWVIDLVHYPRPVTRLTAELSFPAISDGRRVSNRSAGLLSTALRQANVNRYVYTQMAYIPAYEALQPRTSEAFAAMLEADAEAAARMRNAETFIATKAWRSEMQRWDAEVKPAVAREHARFIAVDPRRLASPALALHVEQCAQQLSHTAALHHVFNMVANVPVGDFLAHATRWTGLPPSSFMGVFRGLSPVSLGPVGELEALQAAVEADPAAARLLSGDLPVLEVLESLQALPAPMGALAAAYVSAAGYRTIGGFGVMDRYALEFPETLLDVIRGPRPARDSEANDAREATAANIRSAVPADSRVVFDELLADAQLVYRLKDERGVLNNFVSAALFRRAVLEAGERIASVGRLVAGEHLCEASMDEMRTLLAGGTGPGAVELASRQAFRMTHDSSTVPLVLGEPLIDRPPVEWLPPAAQRVAVAVEAVMMATAGVPGKGDGIRGEPASRGAAVGTARIVRGDLDFERIQPGDVLVTVSTNPSYSALMPLLSAVVTDTGGPLSHAAIVAREYGLPAVVGCGDATRRIPDGARVRVDANSGEVTLLD